MARRKNPKRYSRNKRKGKKYGSTEARLTRKFKRASRMMDRHETWDPNAKNRRRKKWRSSNYRAGKQLRQHYRQRANPPISPSDLAALRRILKAHTGTKRRNPSALTKFKRAGKNQWLNGQYGPRSRKMNRRKYSKWTTARNRAGRRLSREDLLQRPPRRNPGCSSGLYDVMVRAGKRWYKAGSKMSKEDAQREKNYQLRAELNGKKVTHVYLRPAR